MSILAPGGLETAGEWRACWPREQRRPKGTDVPKGGGGIKSNTSVFTPRGWCHRGDVFDSILGARVVWERHRRHLPLSTGGHHSIGT